MEEKVIYFTANEQRLEEENKKLKDQITLALKDMVYLSQGGEFLMWGKNGGTKPHKSFLNLMDSVSYSVK